MTNSLLESGDHTSTLIRALKVPAAYHHPVTTVELLETHISWVLLTGQFAYKLKKPVNLGFVDFTTLERRQFFCREELRLNRRLAPELYLDVAPITGTAAAPHVGGTGAPIEWAVKMRQFEQDQLLSRVIAADKLRSAQVDSLARHVAEFHASIPVAEAATRYGTPAAVADPIRANFVHLAIQEHDRDADLIERLKGWCDQELQECDRLLLARKANGFVRECHGDMHLGNMVLANDVIVIFDCIEFNEDLRWIDVFSDIAFCAMDLEDRGRPDLAHRFVSGYLEWSGDYEGLEVFPLYFVYRALVRAKVTRLRCSQADCSPTEVERLNREFRDYLVLAERSTHRPRPFLAITHGVSGSGKTFGSQIVVDRLGAIRIRSDVERKRLAGIDPLASSGSGICADLYSPDFTDRTYERLRTLAAEVLENGFPALVDAAFLKRGHRELLRRLAETMDVSFMVLDFPSDELTCRERIGRRTEFTKNASEATEAVLHEQLRTRQPLSTEELAFVIAFDTQHESSIERALSRVERRRTKQFQ